MASTVSGRILSIAAAALVALALIASPGLPIQGAGMKVVGSLIWNTSIPFYTNLIKGEQDAAKKYGLDVQIHNGQGELAKEIAVIQQFVTQKVDVMLVTPSDAEGIVPAVKQANEANIPVIEVNNRVGKGAKTVTYVGADDYAFGKRQGELLVQAIGKTGKVALLMGKLGTSPQILRGNGLKDYLKAYPGIQIISEASDEWDYAKNLALTQNLLAKYSKGSLAAIVCQGPEGVAGAREAKKTGRTDVKFVVGDYPSDVRDAIRDGAVFGTVDQDPYPQGFRGVELAHWYLTGKKSQIPTPNDYLSLPLVTKANVEKMRPAW